MSATRVVFTGKQQVQLEPFEPGPVGEGQILIRTLYTLMSTGTENIVFNRLFDPGTGWHDWVKYPFYPGYSTIGEIVEIGPGVENRSVGQRVTARLPHASHHVAAAAETVVVPDGISSSDAAWFALAKIAFMGAKVSDYHLGDSLLVIGAGPIGQMTVRWASAAGLAHIIVVDPVATRLTFALAGGATAVINKPVTECKDDVLAAMGGTLPRIVNDSTGNAAVFAAALGLADQRGRVVILGDTGTPAGQHLTHDVIGRGLTIVGAHDGHNDAQWDNSTISEFFFKLAGRGKFDLSGLNTHFFKPQDVEQAYQTVNTKRGETMGVVFDWTEA